MKVDSQSFVTVTALPERVIKSALRFSSSGGTTGILFLAGKLCSHSQTIATGLALRSPERQWLVVCAPGVLTESGDLENTTAAVGMILRVPSSLQISRRANARFANDLSDKLVDNPGSCACVLVRGDDAEGEWVPQYSESANMKSNAIFGGGTLPGAPLLVSRGGVVESGAIAALIIHGPTISRVSSSSACRLLSPLCEATKSRGRLLLEIDGCAALERLSQSAASLDAHQLILLAFGPPGTALTPSGRRLAVRAIEGVDPGRGAIVLSEKIPPGMRLAFAVRDAHASRKDLEAHLSTLARGGAGSSAAFGIYICCAGRGEGLYGTPGVDTRLIARSFPNMPLIGLHSTFEIAPLGDSLATQIYSGVLALFSQPS